MFPSALRIDLLGPELLRAFQARPERLRERFAAQPEAHTIVIDEIQNAPQLLDVVHSLLEEQPELRFVLTGSSARKVKIGLPICWAGGWCRLLCQRSWPQSMAQLLIFQGRSRSAWCL